MIPSSSRFDQTTMMALLEHDPLVTHYHVFFASLDWSIVAAWEARRSPRRRPAHPESDPDLVIWLNVRQNQPQ